MINRYFLSLCKKLFQMSGESNIERIQNFRENKENERGILIKII